MEFKRIICESCGNDKFIKSSIESCNAVPPFFKCSKCGKFLKQKIAKNLNPANKILSGHMPFPINTKEELFMGHLKCVECGIEAEGELPKGWTISDIISDDKIRIYAHCPVHSK